MLVSGTLFLIAGAVAGTGNSAEWRADMQRSTDQFLKTVGSCVQFTKAIDADEVDILALKLVFKGTKPTAGSMYESYMETWIGECVAKAARSWDWPAPPETPAGVVLPIQIKNLKLSRGAPIEFAPPGSPDGDYRPRLPLPLVRQYVYDARAAFGKRCLESRVSRENDDVSARLVMMGAIDETGGIELTLTKPGADKTLDDCALSVFGAVHVPAGFEDTPAFQVEVRASGEGGEYALAAEKTWTWHTRTRVSWADTGPEKPRQTDPYLWLYAADAGIAVELPEIEHCFLDTATPELRLEGLLIAAANGDVFPAVTAEKESREALECARMALARTMVPTGDETRAIRFHLDRFGGGITLLDGVRYAGKTEMGGGLPAGLLDAAALAGCTDQAANYAILRDPGMVHRIAALAGEESNTDRACTRAVVNVDDAPEAGPGSLTVFSVAEEIENPPSTVLIDTPVTWQGPPGLSRRMVDSPFGLDQAQSLVPSLSAQILRCAAPAVAGATAFRGTVSVAFSLDGKGGINESKVLASSLPKAVTKCVESEVHSLQFLQPPDGRPAHFVWTWTLSGGG